MADFTTPYATRLCFSGLESRRLLDTFAQFQIPHIMVSYYYLRRVFEDPKEFEEYAKSFKTVIIDSGVVFGGFKTDDQKKDFLESYAEYVGGLNKGAYTAAVCDKGVRLDGVLPDEMLIYPLDDLLEVFEHSYSAIFENIKYVGVGTKRGKEDEIAPIFSAARKRGAYVHAFGTASKAYLLKFPFYSANTSSWRSGSRYLNTYIYEGPGRGLKLTQPTDKGDDQKTERELSIVRRRQRNMINVRQPNIAPLIDWGAVSEGDSWEVDKANLTQWMLYQKDLGLMGHNKYYLGADEKDQLVERKRTEHGAAAESTRSRRDMDGDMGINSSRANSGADTRGANIDGANSSTSNSSNINPGVVGLVDSVVPATATEARSQGYREEEEATHGDNSSSTNSSSDHSRVRGNNGMEVDRSPDIEGDVVDAEVVEEGSSVPANQQSDIGGDPSTPHTPPSTDLVQTTGDAIATPLPIAPAHPADERLFARRECDFCSMQGRCPRYEPGAECAYGYTKEEQYDVGRIEDHIMTDATRLLQLQMDRISHAAMEERKDGAGVSKDLNREIKTYMELVQLLAEATDKRDEVTVHAKGTGALAALMGKKKS